MAFLGTGSQGALRPLSFFAETVPGLYDQLDDAQRTSVIASLAVIATATGFLVLFVLVAGRIARWYINRQPRATKLKGDPFASVIDGKPRPSHRETQNWRQR